MVTYFESFASIIIERVIQKTTLKDSVLIVDIVGRSSFVIHDLIGLYGTAN